MVRYTIHGLDVGQHVGGQHGDRVEEGQEEEAGQPAAPRLRAATWQVNIDKFVTTLWLEGNGHDARLENEPRKPLGV